MFSPKAKRNLRRIIPFGVIWLLLGWVFLAVEHLAVDGNQNMADTAIRMTFPIFVFASFAVTLVGLFVGLVELIYLKGLFSKRKFWEKIVYKTLIYSGILFVIILIMFPLAKSIELGTGIFNKVVWEDYAAYLKSRTHLSTNIQLATSLALSLFYAEMSDNIGHSELLSFFTGKYHKPIEETRVFMFLDMRSSTTIAEKLGHIEYFKLLKQYYVDISDAILRHDGEIYQYVGDEVIVSWKVKGGKADNECIRCFFSMKADLLARKNWYLDRFGLAPEFKAGIHVGKVTTGEIGVLKKEIMFTGDVLNAAARIQALCNEYGVDILVSQRLADTIPLEDLCKVRSIGELELRGKEEKMEVFTLEQQA